MNNFFNKLNKFIPFWPLIPFYLICIALFNSGTELIGDEHRYLKYANRLLNGTYVGNPDNPDLINGPGWPLIVSIFTFFKIPIMALRYLNAIQLWASVVIVNKILKMFAKGPKVTLWTLVFALYPYFLVKSLPRFLSELFAILMICTFFLYFFKIHFKKEENRLHYVWASLAMGMLILIRVQFAYIGVAGVLLGGVYSLIFRNSKGIRTSIIMAASFIICIPYLFYTWQLTGKVFYWGTNGGEQLYWMTSPYPGQWGNWISPTFIEDYPERYPPDQVVFILENEELNFVETNDRYVEAALENLKEHPEVYFKNYLANLGRMAFNFPHSYEPQKLDTYFFIFSNFFYLFCLLMSMIPLIVHFRRIPFTIAAMGLFILMYLGGTSLMAAVFRYITLSLPLVTIWLGYVSEKFVLIKIKQDVDQD